MPNGYFGFLTVQHTYLSLLSYATPATIAGSLSDRALWDLGWWSSFALILPDSDRPAWHESTPAPEPPALLPQVVRLFHKLRGIGRPGQYQPYEVALAPGVDAAWLRYRRALAYDLLTPDLDARLWTAYPHLPVQLIKVATLLAALDWVAALPPDPPPAPKTRGYAEAPPHPPARARPDPSPWPTSPAPNPSSRPGAPASTAPSPPTAPPPPATWTPASCARSRNTPLPAPPPATSTAAWPTASPTRLRLAWPNLVTLGLVETVPAPDQPGPGRPTTYYRVASS